MRFAIIFAVNVSIAAIILVSLSSFDSKINAITNVNTTHFSVNIPDNWRYAEHSRPGMTELHSMEAVNLLTLAPADFAESLIVNKDKISPYAKMFSKGAYSTLRQDTDYIDKNSTLDSYVKYRVDSLIPGVNLTSQQDTTVSNQKAVRIEGNGINKLVNLKYMAYIVLYENEPYYLEYVANEKDFQKYLPQFEEMVTTFRFEN
jgi:hypothetical protein